MPQPEEATLPDPPTTTTPPPADATDAETRAWCLVEANQLALAHQIDPFQVTRFAARFERYLRTGSGLGPAAALLPPEVTLVRTGETSLTIQIPAGFAARLTLPQPVDPDGQPTRYGSPVAWSSADAAACPAVAESDDGMVGLLGPMPTEGVPVQITLTAKAGPEDDAATLTLSTDAVGTPGDGVALNIGNVELVRVTPAQPPAAA